LSMASLDALGWVTVFLCDLSLVQFRRTPAQSPVRRALVPSAQQPAPIPRGSEHLPAPSLLYSPVQSRQPTLGLEVVPSCASARPISYRHTRWACWAATCPPLPRRGHAGSCAQFTRCCIPDIMPVRGTPPPEGREACALHMSAVLPSTTQQTRYRRLASVIRSRSAPRPAHVVTGATSRLGPRIHPRRHACMPAAQNSGS
jgi:hypothetical protein